MASIIEFRRALHQIPELAFHETQTQAYVLQTLRNMGWDPRPIAGTGVVVDIDSGRPGPTVMFRADMDGLPLTEETGLAFASRHTGVMHACGHDGHMAILLGLAERLAEGAPFQGRVRLAFQPAEERPPGGALQMIEAGVLDGVDEVYGLHLWAGFPVGTIGLRPGPMMANADEFRIVVTGRGGHGSQPEATADAVLLASQIVVNLQTVVSRRVPALEPAVVTCGTIQGGHTFNIIAERAEITGTVRTFSAETQALVRQEMAHIARTTALLYGADAELVYNPGYPALINAEEPTRRWQARLREWATVVEPEPSMGGEDFAYYLHHRPGAFLFLGARPDVEYPHHSPHFQINEDALALGVEAFWNVIRT